MDTASLLILSVGLAMDAFAASICKGLSEKTHSIKNSLSVGLCFGFFQALMPVIGFTLGRNFAEEIRAIDHWIAFLNIDIVKSASTIGIITAILSVIGFKIGSKLGLKSKQMAELTGGIILIGLGIKILIEHLFFQ